jgi:hypothetical protein
MIDLRNAGSVSCWVDLSICHWTLVELILRMGVYRRFRGPTRSMDDQRSDNEITRVRARLRLLEAERVRLETRLSELERRPPSAAHADVSASVSPPGLPTAASSVADKVALFRNLFAGRSDVFPVRWSTRTTGKLGYAPACANEWVKGVCGKPQVKCGECPNKAFIPASDAVIEKHLRGGDYPKHSWRSLRRRGRTIDRDRSSHAAATSEASGSVGSCSEPRGPSANLCAVAGSGSRMVAYSVSSTPGPDYTSGTPTTRGAVLEVRHVFSRRC